MKELNIHDYFWLGGPLKCKVTNEETGLEEEKICSEKDDMCIVDKSSGSPIYNCTSLTETLKMVKNYNCDTLPSFPGCLRVVRFKILF